MLVRRIRYQQGESAGHLLANVAAVFVDEAHCFDSSVRGDQLVFLLARLRKLRSSALAKGWTSADGIQACAASATVHEPEVLAQRLLGSGAEAIVSPGSRPMEIWTADNRWLRIEPSISPNSLAKLLPRTTAVDEVCELVWKTLESGEARKALIFVPSRRECDLLGRELRRFLGAHREMCVDSHHGSLSREHRQRAEDDFQRHRDAVLVATNTLEVGVDIGDVDVVALVGAPADTSSLLQRIGRGGRRSGLTRLLPIARNHIDAAALGSQIANAVRGILELKHRFNRWDVLPQQVISYIRQNQGRGRNLAALLSLVADAWPGSGVNSLAEAHIEAWLRGGRLMESRSMLHLAGEWGNFAAHAESDYTIHSNIRSSAAGFAVRNELTGEVIGHVTAKSEDNNTLTIGGRQHRVTQQDSTIIVTPVTDQAIENREDTPKYGGRRRRVSETFAAHVRTGCGFGNEEAPIVTTSNGLVWFHFGGEVFESVSRALFPHLFGSTAITGVALRVIREFSSDSLHSLSKSQLIRINESEGLRLLEDEGLGRFADHIPEAGVAALVSALRIDERYIEWITTRQIAPPQPIAERASLQFLLVGT
jgi:Lhr-like helicase